MAGLRKKVELATASPVGVTRLLPPNAFRKSSPSSRPRRVGLEVRIKKRTEATTKVVAGLKEEAGGGRPSASRVVVSLPAHALPPTGRRRRFRSLAEVT